MHWNRWNGGNKLRLFWKEGVVFVPTGLGTTYILTADGIRPIGASSKYPTIIELKTVIKPVMLYDSYRQGGFTMEENQGFTLDFLFLIQDAGEVVTSRAKEMFGEYLVSFLPDTIEYSCNITVEHMVYSKGGDDGRGSTSFTIRCQGLDLLTYEDLPTINYT